MTTHRLALAVAMMGCAIAAAGCNQKREATAEAGDATAKVTTEQPSDQVSDAQLKAAAEGAASVAAAPQGANAPAGTAETK